MMFIIREIMLEYGSITTLEDLNIIIKQFLTKKIMKSQNFKENL